MTVEKMIDEMYADPNLIDNVTNKNSHFNKHIQKSDVNMLSRTMNEVDADSTIDDKTKAIYMFEEALLYQHKYIFANLPHMENGDDLDFDVTFSPEDCDDIPYVGHGYMIDKINNTIKECEIHTLRCVIECDDTMKYGFALRTSYPNAYAPDTKPTGRDLTDIVKQTEQYQKAEPVKKAYLLYRTNPNNTNLVTYKAGMTQNDSVLSYHIPTTNPNTKHVIRIKEDSLSLSTMVGHEKITSKYTQLRNELRPDKTYYHQNVNLNNPAIWDVFQKDYPQDANIIHELQQIVKTELQTSAERTHADRVQRAKNLSDNLSTQSDDKTFTPID